MNVRWDREVKGWEGPEHRSFCPPGVGVWHPSEIWMCSPSWKLSEPPATGILMHASSLRHDLSLTPFSTLLSPQENVGGGGAKNSKLLIVSWSFQRPSPIQKLSRSPSKVASLEQMTLLSPRKFQGFLGLSVRNWVSDAKYQNQRSNLCSCHLWNSKDFRSLVSETRQRPTTYISSHKSQNHRIYARRLESRFRF